MRVIFNRSNYLNTNISDEQGTVLYNVSTPSVFFSPVTTIKKYTQGGQGSVEETQETMCIIEWPRLFKKALFRFNGNVIPADEMFGTRMWRSWLSFSGPDQRTYKWMLSRRRWMKLDDTNVQLVRYHPKNWGIRKPSHPAYLDVSPEVVSMLDHIIFTFVYAEWKYEQLKKRRHTQAELAGHVASSIVHALV